MSAASCVKLVHRQFGEVQLELESTVPFVSGPHEAIILTIQSCFCFKPRSASAGEEPLQCVIVKANVHNKGQ